MTRHVLYQLSEPNELDLIEAVTFDSNTEGEKITEREILGYVARFNVTIAQRKIIDTPGATVKVVDGELLAELPLPDPLAPIFEAEQERKQAEMEEYQAWLQTPAGQVAQQYMYYQQHGEFPPGASN